MASVAGAYARAFADLITEKRLDGERSLGELRAVGGLIGANEDLRRVWENPTIPREQKRKVLDGLARRDGWSQPVRNFMAVLIDHQRVAFFPQILAQLEKELNDRMGIADAQISSARDLNDFEKRGLESQVSKLTGKRVRATYSRDTSLLGGAVVRISSTIYDGSVLGQLQRIREQIAEGGV